MNYDNKIVVAYKNPGHNFATPYITSIYSGMMLEQICNKRKRAIPAVTIPANAFFFSIFLEALSLVSFSHYFRSGRSDTQDRPYQLNTLLRLRSYLTPVKLNFTFFFSVYRTLSFTFTLFTR